MSSSTSSSSAGCVLSVVGAIPEPRWVKSSSRWIEAPGALPTDGVTVRALRLRSAAVAALPILDWSRRTSCGETDAGSTCACFSAADARAPLGAGGWSAAGFALAGRFAGLRPRVAVIVDPNRGNDRACPSPTRGRRREAPEFLSLSAARVSAGERLSMPLPSVLPPVRSSLLSETKDGYARPVRPRATSFVSPVAPLR